jgi:hypothetical protein
MMLLWVVKYPKKLKKLIGPRPALETNWPMTAMRIARMARRRKNPGTSFTVLGQSEWDGLASIHQCGSRY